MICASRPVPSVDRDERLRLAAREDRRTVSTRQRADFDADRAHGLEVAAVDTRLAREDHVADQSVLEVVQLGRHLVLGELRLLAAGQGRLRRLADLGEARDARLLDDEAVGGGVVSLGQLGDRLLECDVFLGRLPVPARLAGFGGKLVDRRDRDLHLLVAEEHGAQHHVFGEALGFRLDHQHGVLRARDHEVEVGLRLDLCRRRVEEVLAVLVSDPRGADRRGERDAGQRDSRRRANQRRNVRVDLRDRARAPSPRSGLRCRSLPETAAAGDGRSGGRSASPSRKDGPRA